MVPHPGQKLKLRVAHASREFHPSEDLSELPLPGQEYHAGAVIARQIGHDLLSGRLDPLPTLFAAFMQIDLHRWIFALPPMSLPILCLYKAHQRMYFRFWICTLQGTGEKCSPFQYYAGIEHNSMTDSQKFPIKFIKNLSFDRVFLCFRLTPDWDIFAFRAYSVSRIPSK